MVRPATYDGRFVHFCISYDLCHLRHADSAKHLQKYKGRVVIRVDNNDGYKAVFTEQRASASRMAAARFLDIIARLPTMAGAAKQDTTKNASTGVGRSQIAEIAGERMPTSMNTTDTSQSMTETRGYPLKNQSFSLDETFSVILWQDCFGKEDWKEFD